MARPHKLAKTMELQNFDDDDENIFSNLPDHIVHRIHSFLPLKDLSRLCCVSRRFRDLRISNSCLVLCNIDCYHNLLNRYRFKNFLDRFVVRRSLYGVKTHQLFLLWFFEGSLEDETYRVNTWLYQAVNSGLKQIEIELTIGGFAYALPPCVLSCNSLKSLVVVINNGIIKFPSASLAGSVTTLERLILESVRIEDDYLEEALSNFNSLKCLILTKISGLKRMTINSSTIDKLIIRDCNDLQIINISAEKLRNLLILWRPNYSGGTSLKINAPNLVTFEWGGYVVDFYYIDNFSSPMYASIALGLSHHRQYESSSIKCNLDKLLHSMRRAKSLKLWDKFVEVKITLPSFSKLYISLWV
jgi:hypothetical protein